MGGLIRHPVANRDNEVVAANLPEIKEPQSCPELARLKVADVLKLKLREWSRITYTCTPARPSHTDSLQIAERAADVSIESASLAPTDAARLLWSSRHVIPSIAVTYVLLGRQAEGARLLFLAGAAVGLSGAFLPLGIEPLARTVLDRRRRGRQSSLRVRQKRSALPKNYGQEGTRLYRHKSRLTPRRRR